jgi:hypothetical protein
MTASVPKPVWVGIRSAARLGDPPVVEEPSPEIPLEIDHRCMKCGALLPAATIGRPRLYCSIECRRAEALRLRRLRRPIPAWRMAYLAMRESKANETENQR